MFYDFLNINNKIYLKLKYLYKNCKPIIWTFYVNISYSKYCTFNERRYLLKCNNNIETVKIGTK